MQCTILYILYNVPLSRYPLSVEYNSNDWNRKICTMQDTKGNTHMEGLIGEPVKMDKKFQV